MPRIHLLYPLTLVRGFWDDVMSQAHSFITSTWTFYLQADDGKVVIFQVQYELKKARLSNITPVTCMQTNTGRPVIMQMQCFN